MYFVHDGILDIVTCVFHAIIPVGCVYDVLEINVHHQPDHGVNPNALISPATAGRKLPLVSFTKID